MLLSSCYYPATIAAYLAFATDDGNHILEISEPVLYDMSGTNSLEWQGGTGGSSLPGIIDNS